MVLRRPHQRQRVLGEARPAIAWAGMQELPSDPPIQPNATRDIVDIGADFFAQIGHFVDERDFHRQERVARVFGQLRRFDAGVQDRRFDQVQRPVETAQYFARAGRFGPDHDAIGPHEIGDGIALAQEFRVRRDVDFQIGADRGDDFLDPASRADGDGRFGHDHGGALQRACHLLHRRINISQVRVPVAAPRRGANRDEDGFGILYPRGEVAGEGQTARGDIFPHQLFQAWLEDRHTAVFQLSQLAGVGFDHSDLGAEFRETGARDEADIASTDQRDAHGRNSFSRVRRR